jgi:hypothetical protein
MLEIRADASVATGLDTGLKIAMPVGKTFHHQTEVASIMQATPQLIEPEEEDLMKGHPGEAVNENLFDELVEVKDFCEFEVSISYQSTSERQFKEKH